MPLPSTAKKPLLLVFPFARTVNYERCLVLARHLRSLFEIRFLHADKWAHLVYQHGFDTFSGALFPSSTTGFANNNAIDVTENDLELQFLEQVEMLESLQPALVLGDGIHTLSMAAEFTGIPFISLINGYQSPYFANEYALLKHLYTANPFQVLRVKYGLKEKHTIYEEWEGDLNWICDLPELFPQRELPYRYELVGPLSDEAKAGSATLSTLNPFKKTILLDIDNSLSTQTLTLLNSEYFRRYNLVAETTKGNLELSKKIRSLSLDSTSQLLSKVDLLLCDTERMVYNALLHEIPILFLNNNLFKSPISVALEHWCIGSSWDFTNPELNDKNLEYWLNHKHTDAHRAVRYMVKAAITTLEHKVHRSIALHFPFLEKRAISCT